MTSNGLSTQYGIGHSRVCAMTARLNVINRVADTFSYARSAMIQIKKSKTADTRTCDFTKVSREQLLASSLQHLGDVHKGLAFFAAQIVECAGRHDFDKLSDIDGFHRDFITGFTQTTWWTAHRQLNRHHLTMSDGVRDDVNLIDVLDFIVDCVMAGMGRSGSVYKLELPPGLLETAFQNTVDMLKAQVVVEPDDA